MRLFSFHSHCICVLPPPPIPLSLLLSLFPHSGPVLPPLNTLSSPHPSPSFLTSSIHRHLPPLPQSFAHSPLLASSLQQSPNTSCSCTHATNGRARNRKGCGEREEGKDVRTTLLDGTGAMNVEGKGCRQTDGWTDGRRRRRGDGSRREATAWRIPLSTQL